MSVIATVTVPGEEFMLDATIGSDPDLRVRLDRVIPIGDVVIPYLWASDDSVEAIEAELEAEAEIESFKVVDSMDCEALVRVVWAEREGGLLEAMADAGATILEAIGQQGRWWVQLRFDDHDELARFYRRCRTERIGIDLERVHNPGRPPSLGLEDALTDEQRETLQLALEEGYFDVPRGITLVQLADRLGLSDSAVSQRLRRGIAAVLGETHLEVDGPPS